MTPHGVLILDNATFHQSETIRDNLETQGHTLLYLPPYSPDLNPYFYPQVLERM